MSCGAGDTFLLRFDSIRSGYFHVTHMSSMLCKEHGRLSQACPRLLAVLSLPLFSVRISLLMCHLAQLSLPGG